ncbi:MULTISPECIES: metallophosphoesterase family protein [unclassified Roseofilum]|uniref:metallophosphoesterase family protein n=1 Tax=unclassified Roseofilum TaxID=2620099 RepID=UPI000E8FCA01|nr:MULTISPECIES: metallophosphoesterase family protein [unclassified Roseofilum]MBP0007916.1 serine/threonine protein phosphatase [Roseofilum sp. Belize Diploria]MBP0032323.1 serine/threonine protein phosphatase [Roseofilum sp. Belize BBD 4]HBQ97855.1 serine/threonine protein phosphatase [Cyanobacteria bacterium UBA11691]
MIGATGRRVFIGDVHGNYDGLMHLLEAIAPVESDDLYFLGDLIDRGPKSAETVNFVRDSGYPCIRGNHEQLLIDSFPDGKIHYPALQAWLYSGGQATLSSYQDAQLLLEHLQWISNLPLYLDLGDVWLVHAGVHPDLPIDEQTEYELCWIRDRFHCIPTPYFPDKTIITGHTITFTFPGVLPGQIVQGQGWLDIDTGAYHRRSGWLTALDWTNQQVYQVNIYHQAVRVLPLEESITFIEPEAIIPRHPVAANH